MGDRRPLPRTITDRSTVTGLTEPAAATRRMSPVVPQRRPCTALVVVRTPQVREAATHTARAVGARIVLSAETIAAVTARPRPVDLVMVEADLPDGPGSVLLDATAARGVVVLAATPDPYSVRAAVTAGVRCYLVSAAPSGPRPVTGDGEGADGLSAREVEVLQLAADGNSNRAIGDRLGLSALTIKSHLARIARKLGTGDRAEMVAVAMRAGVIA